MILPLYRVLCLKNYARQQTSGDKNEIIQKSSTPNEVCDDEEECDMNLHKNKMKNKRTKNHDNHKTSSLANKFFKNNQNPNQDERHHLSSTLDQNSTSNCNSNRHTNQTVMSSLTTEPISETDKETVKVDINYHPKRAANIAQHV